MTKNVKPDVAQGKAAPCPPGGPELDLFRMAGFDAATARYLHGHLVLERTEQVVRRVRYLTGDTFAQRQLVRLAHDLIELSGKEVDATLDGDVERAARLRRRYWLAENEYLRLLTRLNEELDAIFGR